MTIDPPGGPGTPTTGESSPRGAGGRRASGFELDEPRWWEDGRGFDEGDGWAPFPRRRRSRVLKATGAVVAGALVLASVSSTIEVVFGSRAKPPAPASSTGSGARTTSPPREVAGTVVADHATYFLVKTGVGTQRVGTSTRTTVCASTCGAGLIAVQPGDYVVATLGSNGAASLVDVNPATV